MPKYLLKVQYTGEGLAGVMKDGGSARRAIAEQLAKSVGGSVETFHFAFGDVDAYLICDLPDNKAAAKIAMTVSGSGRVTITTVPLLTIDEIDDIAAGSHVEYVAPGT
jgi:uncharacterized protein with GYD domain